ncbi:S8 family serine peptidase [Polaribacter pectinis]|uniref:S8 family serine peptidase n=1 Tax=Polaribacter pectinis TaxID=2738844 RepID=A0A7G9LC23_9FLAO|nr:S8 family serine peptidase [Polaribacter pectinis]QNM86172.1 S8 family serine peptidase [Polaribacter pectinis]
MKKILFLFSFLIFSPLFSQQEEAWLFLKDKPNKDSFLENPLTMLTQRALDRREIQNIALDSLDVPVDENYYNQLKNESTITVLAKSKWLNAVHVIATESQINDLITNYTFIDHIEFANKSLNRSGKKQQKTITPNHHQKFNEIETTFVYGDSENQIKMLKGEFLHEQGLTGGNQHIAVIDAGFPNVNTLAAFKRLRDNNQILGGYDFVERKAEFYTGHNHGTNVLSTIGGYLEDEFVGSAPDAFFYLFRTEDASREVPLEESLWVEAAERADSLGVDVINTSLGYTTFDEAKYNYSYADMDGKTTFISRGAEIGSSRGMLLVVSAGNEGNKDWKYISAPADATSVITVGAVDASGNIAGFSSYGPSSDGRIKPEILAQGQNPALINHTTGEVVTTSSGTSFSGPIIAGLIACLNQQLPAFIKSSGKKSSDTNYHTNLKRGVYESADKYSNPLEQHGYGIPNFEVAQQIYFSLYPASVNDNLLSDFSIYPNPVNNSFIIDSKNLNIEEFNIQIYTILGKKVVEKSKIFTNTIDVSYLESGIYLLKIQKGNQHKTLKLIKN